MSKKQSITFGDLVEVDGYEGRLYYVDSYVVHNIHLPSEAYTEVWYDLTCAHTGDFQIAEQEDISLVCEADQAEDYLRKAGLRKAMKDPLIQDQLDRLFGRLENKPAQGVKKVTNGNKSERVDELLTKLSDYHTLIREFGSEDDIGQEWLKEIDNTKAELARLTK